MSDLPGIGPEGPYRNLLVTGGAGFIGSALVRHLVGARGARVINLDKLTYAANLDSLRAVEGDSRHVLERVDLCDAAAVAGVLQRHRPDAVIHLAAESHVDRSIDGPAAFIQTNVVGSYNLLEACRDYWRRLAGPAQRDFRLLHVSTDEVYGSLGDTGGFSETTAYRPNSPYSASKAASDHLARAWHHTYGLPVLISNCSNNYGPFQFPEKLMPVVILAALEGREIPVYGRGLNVRDWLHVDDHVRALELILTRGQVGETYCIGGNAELANLDLVRQLCAVMDALRPDAPHAPHASLIRFVADRPGHDLRYAIDSTKIRRQLGWSPMIAPAQGLADTVRWYLDNAWWWQRIRERGFRADRLGLAEGGTGRRP